MYAKPHDHSIYGRGHSERVNKMIELGRQFGPYTSSVDLSCGNGYVIDQIESQYRIKGDIAPGYEYHGPIEDTIHLIPQVSLFVSGETLEHLDNPARILYYIRSVCDYLLLSTPIDNWNDSNAEHYWAWAKSDVESLLHNAGFTAIMAYASVDSRVYGEPYCYGVWIVQ